jgi:hypothetical protein
LFYQEIGNKKSTGSLYDASGLSSIIITVVRLPLKRVTADYMQDLIKENPWITFLNTLAAPAWHIEMHSGEITPSPYPGVISLSSAVLNCG